MVANGSAEVELEVTRLGRQRICGKCCWWAGGKLENVFYFSLDR